MYRIKFLIQTQIYFFFTKPNETQTKSSGDIPKYY